MKKVAIVVGIIIVVAAAWWGYSTYVAQPATPVTTEASEDDEAADLDNVIWASGKLVPRRWAGLSPAIAGTVADIHASEGDQVEADTVLAEIDNAVLKSQIAVSAAAVAEAEAAKAKLLARTTQSDLDAAQADIAAAEAAVTLAKAQLQEEQEAIAVSEAQIAIAQAQYNELASHPTRTEKITAQLEIDLAKAELDRAQAAYNSVKGNPHIGAMPESAALQQATTSYESAKAAFDAASQGATRQELAVAQAQINAARMEKKVAESQIPAAEATVKSAQAQLARAQAALDALMIGATTEDIAVAEASIQSAKAALAAAQAQVDETLVIAPFDGQVGTIFVRTGELGTPGSPVLMLGDTTDMRVETTDLRETDVTRLDVGMPVEVTFDAVPNEIFNGTIVRVAPMSTVDKGSTNYTVIVEVEDLDPGLRWGMTAFVNIDAAQ